MRFKFCRGQNIENELIDSTEKEKENEIKNKIKKLDIKKISSRFINRKINDKNK